RQRLGRVTHHLPRRLAAPPVARSARHFHVVRLVVARLALGRERTDRPVADAPSRLVEVVAPGGGDVVGVLVKSFGSGISGIFIGFLFSGSSSTHLTLSAASGIHVSRSSFIFVARLAPRSSSDTSIFSALLFVVAFSISSYTLFTSLRRSKSSVKPFGI